jgi:HEAT repeat protein
MRRRRDALGLARATRYAEVVSSVKGEVVDLGTPVRRDALLALADLRLSNPDPAVLDAIHAATLDPDEEVAMAAVEALVAAAEDIAAQDTLIRAAASTLIAVGRERPRLRALEGIASFGPGAPALLAREIVQRKGTSPLTERDRDALMLVLEATTGDTGADVHVLDVLTDALADSRQEVRDRVDQAFRWFGGEALEHLLAALQQPSTRTQATSALGATGHLRAVPALCDALVDENPEVRRAAAHALGQIKTPRAVEALLRATDDEDYVVRAEAMGALDGLGTVGIVASIDSLARASRPLAPTSAPRSLTVAAEPEDQLEAPAAAEAEAERAIPELDEPAHSAPTPQPQMPVDAGAAGSLDAAATNGGRILWPGLRRILEQRSVIEQTRGASQESESSGGL